MEINTIKTKSRLFKSLQIRGIRKASILTYTAIHKGADFLKQRKKPGFFNNLKV